MHNATNYSLFYTASPYRITLQMWCHRLRTMPPVSDSSVSVVVQLVCCAVWHAGKQKYWYDCAAHTEAAVVTGMCGSKWMVQQELGRWDEG